MLLHVHKKNLLYFKIFGKKIIRETSPPGMTKRQARDKLYPRTALWWGSNNTIQWKLPLPDII